MQPSQAGRMSNRQFNLPAGQNVGAGVGMGMPGGGDLVASGSHGHMGGGGGPRRRGGGYGGGPAHGPNYAQQQQQHHYQQQHHMYGGGYMYPNNQFYQGMPSGTGYQNAGMHNPGYIPYNNQYSRSSASMQQYASMMGVGSPGYNGRQSQPSPALAALATPYQPPPVPAPMAPHTPNSALSHTSPAAAQPISPPTSQTMATQPLVVSSEALHPVPALAPPATETTTVALSPSAVPAHASPVTATSSLGTSQPTESTRAPFRPPLPWFSRPDLPFPAKTPKRKKKRMFTGHGSASLSESTQISQQKGRLGKAPQTKDRPLEHSMPAQVEDAVATPMSTPTKPASPVPASLASDTTSSIAVATPSSSQEEAVVAPANIVKPASRTVVPAVPAVPVVPVLPKANPKDARAPTSDKPPAKPIEPATEVASTTAPTADAPASTSASESASAQPEEKQDSSTPSPAPVSKAPPKSWASLLASSASSPKGSSAASSDPNTTTPNGTPLADGQAAVTNNATFGKSTTNTIADALRSYQVTTPEKVVFIQPRGLINTGNMCYMNSVLQVLIFCAPFYEFLDQINKKAAHSFKSETPLIDAMVLFLREFKIIDAATSVEQLRRRLKAEELETFGEPFTPEFVYDVIRRLPRFVDMRRGHQQDAEEFLGFLLQSLDDECSHVMGLSSAMAAVSVPRPEPTTEGSDWLEVGHRQRSAVMRSSGQNSASPISKIFGGFLRSELRIPGLKDSITNEPYQPLQLDIGSPKVHSILDALRNLTTPETIPGNFNPERGAGVPATKQVFIETLPPVLILHLKRFQFDAQGNGTVKLWKKVGYPLELEVPREVFSRQKRNNLLADPAGLPQYRLNAVVYHHGKSASGGHYTADVRRQDGREWMRLDDTSFRRITSTDVAEAGAEEATKNVRKQSPSGQPSNRFGAINGEDTGDDDGWKQVNSAVNGGKRWCSVVHDTPSTTTKSKQAKENIKDNKVAYILFYQRV